MLRLVFEPADRGRVVFDLAWHSETIASLQALRQAPRGAFIDRWRLAARPRAGRAAAELFDVVPADGLVPDFLTPERLSGFPSDRLVRELRCGHGPQAYGTELLALGDALTAYHRNCIAPGMTTLAALLRAELAHRALLSLVEGVDAVLSTLGPEVRWSPPVLEVQTPAEGDIALGGRGLRLVPSMFWTRPAVAVDQYARPTLTYPIHPAPASPPVRRDDPLAALVGATRAGVLRALVTGCGTMQLARELGISPASASGHVTALRDAGLAATRRTGRAVRHTLTPLGLRLLGADRPGT